MTSESVMTPHGNRVPASDMKQIAVLMRHELRKYLRGKRLAGLLAMVAALTLVMFAFIIPGSLGGDLAGSVTEGIHVIPWVSDTYDEYSSAGSLYAGAFGSHIDGTSLVLMLNGTELPDSEWLFLEDDRTVLFRSDFTPPYYVLEASYEYTVDPAVVADGFMDFLSVVLVLCVLFFGADSLASEMQSRTAYLLFPTPMKREVMYLGKLLGGYVASLATLGVFFGLVALLSYASVGSVAEYLPLSFCFAGIYLLACQSFALLVSSLSRGVTGAIVFTLLLLLLVFPAVQSAVASGGVKPWFVPSFAGDAAVYSLQYDDYPQDVNQPGSVTQFFPALGVSAAVLLAYSLGATALGMLSFRRREIT